MDAMWLVIGAIFSVELILLATASPRSITRALQQSKPALIASALWLTYAIGCQATHLTPLAVLQSVALAGVVGYTVATIHRGKKPGRPRETKPEHST